VAGQLDGDAVDIGFLGGPNLQLLEAYKLYERLVGEVSILLYLINEGGNYSAAKNGIKSLF